MTENEGLRFVTRKLDTKTSAEWILLSNRTQSAAAGMRPSSVNDDLRASASSEPDSPLAPIYLLWAAENLAREMRYADAIRSFDAAIDRAGAVTPLLNGMNVQRAAMHHKAAAALHGGDAQLAMDTLRELAKAIPDPAGPLFDAGLIAEAVSREQVAAELYRAAAGENSPSPSTDDPAELARRALRRLEHREVRYAPSAPKLADLLSAALERGDSGQLADLISTTHFAVGPIGGHVRFEEPDLLEKLYEDLGASKVRTQRQLLGTGAKRYLLTDRWRGRWYRGLVAFILTRCPRGWQWTGLAISMSNANWVQRWRPTRLQTNQPLPFDLLAPWPANVSMRAGGHLDFALKLAAVIAAGPFGLFLARRFAASPCGFGPGGYYYNEGSTHDEEDAFSIDFTRYRHNVPFINDSASIPVLAPRAGVVVGACGVRSSGDPHGANMVEILHEDPATGADRFLSRVLHLAGPNLLSVSMGMAVSRGQRLGLVDDTGNSTLDHLHFSIHDQTVPFPGSGSGCSGITRGASVRPTPLSGSRLRAGDSGTCVRSNNVERIPGLHFRPSTRIDFGEVRVGLVKTRTLTIENNTGAAVDVSSPPPPIPVPFMWSGFAATIPDGGTRAIIVRFLPGAPGPAQAMMTVTSNAPGSPHLIQFTGRGSGELPP